MNVCESRSLENSAIRPPNRRKYPSLQNEIFQFRITGPLDFFPWLYSSRRIYMKHIQTKYPRETIVRLLHIRLRATAKHFSRCTRRLSSRQQHTALLPAPCSLSLFVYSNPLHRAVEAHRAVRRRGSHIFSRQSAHRWR
jgi:hypothetical protein